MIKSKKTRESASGEDCFVTSLIVVLLVLYIPVRVIGFVFGGGKL